MGELDVLDETWVLFERPPDVPPVFAQAKRWKPRPTKWIERYDRYDLELRYALVETAYRKGATRAELTPRDFNELCVEAGQFVQYVHVDGVTGIRLMQPDGHLTVVPCG